MAKKDDNLSQIIAGCKKGKESSFSELIDRYGKRFYGYFYRLTGDKETADDLLSEFFLRLVERIRTYRGGRFESWLFRVAKNIFYDHLREKQKEAEKIKGRKIIAESAIEAVKQNDDERTDKLQEQLTRLDEDTRELIMLRFYSELSFKEISKMRAEPIGTTLSKVHRGLNKLRQLMQ